MTQKAARHRIVIVLGAGASRSVSYARDSNITPSPLDNDFFDLLQQVEPSHKETEAARRVQQWCLENPIDRFWESLERAFYTLFYRAELREQFFPEHLSISSTEIINSYALAIQAVLRSAHRKKVCAHHTQLFKRLGKKGRIIHLQL